MTAVPRAMAVTGTGTVVAPAAKLTVAGTPATAALLELKLMVNPLAGAGPERLRVRFWVTKPEIVRLDGEKLMLPVTCTAPLPGVYPGEVALMVAVPRFTAVTCGCAAGAVCPAAMVTVAKDMVTFDGSLLERFTVTPPAGAGDGSVTAKVADCPRPSVVFWGRPIACAGCTVTFAAASAM